MKTLKVMAMLLASLLLIVACDPVLVTGSEVVDDGATDGSTTDGGATDGGATDGGATVDIVLDFEGDAIDTAYASNDDANGSGVIAADPTDAAKKSLKVTATNGYGHGIIMPLTIPTGKTLADYSSVTFKVYYTAEGDADISDKRIQMAVMDDAALASGFSIIQWDGTWADNASASHIGVMDNSKADKLESTDFQSYTFDLTDGNVEDLLTGTSLADATKNLTGAVNIVFGFPHGNSVYYLDDVTLVAVVTAE